MKLLKLFFLFSLILGSSVRAEESPESGTSFSLFKSKTYVKNPMDLRDPFKRRINKKKGAQAQGKTHETGIYNNQTERIEEKAVESIRIVGVMLGKERRAMARIQVGKKVEPEIYYIKEGMKIGPNGAEVKAILPGGIVLVEKIRNVYDQDEYLETVIPVSNE